MPLFISNTLFSCGKHGIQKGKLLFGLNAYLSAFKEFERSADVGNPVDPLQLAALLTWLQTERAESENQACQESHAIQS